MGGGMGIWANFFPQISTKFSYICVFAHKAAAQNGTQSRAATSLFTENVYQGEIRV